MDLAKVPASWDEVSVQQYLSLLTADQGQILQILCGVTEEELNNTERVTVELAMEIIANFYDTPIPKEVHKTFTFKGQTYEIPQNLEFEKWGVYTDWLKISQKADKPDEFIPGTLAFLCRPKGEKYDRLKTIEREELFHELPITVAYGIAAFFLQKQTELEKSITQILTKRTPKQRLLISIYRALDIMGRLTTSLKRTFLKWSASVRKRWAKFSLSSALKGRFGMLRTK